MLPSLFVSSQSGSDAAAPTIQVMKPSLQRVLPVTTSSSVDVTVESPCAAAATKRAGNEISSFGGNTLVGSSITDSSCKDVQSKTEDSSDVGDEDTKSNPKLEAHALDHAVDGKIKVVASPSKVDKAKL